MSKDETQKQQAEPASGEIRAPMVATAPVCDRGLEQAKLRRDCLQMALTRANTANDPRGICEIAQELYAFAMDGVMPEGELARISQRREANRPRAA